jgi:hypothetical protein
MHIVRRVPTERDLNDAETEKARAQLNVDAYRDSTFRAYEKWSQEVLEELARLGYTVDHWTYNQPGEPVGGHLYLTDVGRDRMLIVLRYVTHSLDGIRILRVSSGRESWTARQAAPWLRKRAPLVPRYLR